VTAGNGGEQPDPLHELWLRTRRVLAPFGIAVGTEVLALWRDQAAHGHGPIRAAENRNVRAVEDLIALLRVLTGTGDSTARDEGNPQQASPNVITNDGGPQVR
jgi:hypothetical protein